jgi:hypothetical protein
LDLIHRSQYFPGFYKESSSLKHKQEPSLPCSSNRIDWSRPRIFGFLLVFGLPHVTQVYLIEVNVLKSASSIGLVLLLDPGGCAPELLAPSEVTMIGRCAGVLLVHKYIFTTFLGSIN